jgi:hypothetical protein
VRASVAAPKAPNPRVDVDHSAGVHVVALTPVAAGPLELHLRVGGVSIGRSSYQIEPARLTSPPL